MSRIYSRVEIPAAAAKTGGALQGFVWDQIVQGHEVKFEGGKVKLLGRDPGVQPVFSDLVTIVQEGGRFSGIKLGIKFDSVAAAQQDVPSGVRGSTKLENDAPVPRSFVEWIQSMPGEQDIYRLNGAYYILGAYGPAILTSEELALIHGLTGISVIEWAERVNIINDENTEIIEL